MRKLTPFKNLGKLIPKKQIVEPVKPIEVCCFDCIFLSIAENAGNGYERWYYQKCKSIITTESDFYLPYANEILPSAPFGFCPRFRKIEIPKYLAKIPCQNTLPNKK